MALTKAQQAEVDKAIAAALATAVTAASKPHLVDDLRKTWRKTAEHKAVQLKRFVTLTIFAAFPAIGSLASGGHFDVKTLLAFIGPFAYVAIKQMHPELGASEADSAPGVTIVPAQLDSPVVAPDAVAVPDDMPVEEPTQ